MIATEILILCIRVFNVHQMSLDNKGMVQFNIVDGNNITLLSPEAIGSYIIKTLRETAVRNLSMLVTKAVMSVPAEFNKLQRNYTKRAAELAGAPN